MKTPDGRNRDGFVGIHDNIVSITDPEEFGMPATITPCEGIQLLVNGHPVERMIMVTKKDHVVLNPQIIEQPAKLDVSVDEDGMHAWLDYQQAETILFRVRDQLPVNNLQIHADTIGMPAKTLSLPTMMEKISAAGVTYGIDQSILRELQKNPQEGKYLIAVGMPATDPIDDEIEIYTSWDEPITKKPSEDEDGRIDFWETVEYPIAKVGDTLAIIRRGKEGLDGLSVKGAAIKPRPHMRLDVNCNRTTRIDEEGRILARKKGRPRFDVKSNRWLITIEDRLELPSVSLRTGNVHYVGNVYVMGSVEDTMKVSATGDVVIKGSVNFAQIYAGDSVQIAGGLLSGIVNAGMVNETISGVENDLRVIQQHLLELITNVTEAMRNASVGSVPEVISHLLNTKHTDLSKWMIDFIRNLRSGKIGYSSELTQEVMSLFQPLLGDCSTIQQVTDLQKMMERISEIFHQEVHQEPRGDVVVGYTLNSHIEAKGSVRIIGNGCTNSTISCGGDLYIFHHFRGGEATAGKRIIIASAGSEMGAKTVLKVPINGNVTLYRVYPDTEVRIGRRSITFMKERVNIHISLDTKGDITTRTADRFELSGK